MKDPLEEYRRLRQIMLQLDAVNDEVKADEIRDLMDDVWYALSPEQIEVLRSDLKNESLSNKGDSRSK